MLLNKIYDGLLDYMLEDEMPPLILPICILYIFGFCAAGYVLTTGGLLSLGLIVVHLALAEWMYIDYAKGTQKNDYSTSSLVVTKFGRIFALIPLIYVPSFVIFRFDLVVYHSRKIVEFFNSPEMQSAVLLVGFGTLILAATVAYVWINVKIGRKIIKNNRRGK